LTWGTEACRCGFPFKQTNRDLSKEKIWKERSLDEDGTSWKLFRNRRPRKEAARDEKIANGYTKEVSVVL
jgi:hypothetical protein